VGRHGALVYLPAALVVAIEALVLWPLPWHIGDWFQFWYAGHILAEGKSPLDPAAWRDAVYSYPLVVDDFVTNVRRAELFTDPETPILIPPWIYPPWTAAIFVPFGILPIRIGVVLMHITLLIAGFGALVWLVSRLRLPPQAHALALALAVGVQPFVLASRTGHFTAVLLIGVLLTLVALERRSTPALIGGALILSLKPHLFAVFALVVLAVLVRRREWRTIAITTAALAAFAGLFYWRYPPPVGGTLDAVLHRVTTDDSATTWALAAQLAGGAGPILAVILLAIATAAAWAAVRAVPERLRTVTLVASALAVSLAVSPYVHTYDHVLLLPALLLPLVLTADAPGPVRLGVGAAVIAGGLVYPWLAYFSDVQGRQWPSGGVPFAALALLALSVLIASRRWPRPNRRYLHPSPA
jgi:glycosyl transferase family 87